MSPPKTIVFGPTGAVGSSAARTASALGSPVALAMRDPTKPIPSLSPAAESSARFERVTADLTDPASVSAAITSTGATRAFIYAAHASKDHMRATVEALKAAGIALVVFLSSFTVRGTGAALQQIEPKEVIPYRHAQIEVVLEEVFGEAGFVALRPGSFASNVLQYRPGLASGTVVMQGPRASVDCIVPEDIGRVAGTVLANGVPADGNTRLYLYGPELRPNEESVRMIWRALGRDDEKLKFKVPTREEAYEFALNVRKLPEVVARYMSDRGEVVAAEGQLQVFGYSVEEADFKNVERYTGKPATRYAEWVSANLGLFEGEST